MVITFEPEQFEKNFKKNIKFSLSLNKGKAHQDEIRG